MVRKIEIGNKRSDPYIYKVGDPVILRAPGTSQWKDRGIITDLILGENQVTRSYMVKLSDTDQLVYRPQSYLRHAPPSEDTPLSLPSPAVGG